MKRAVVTIALVVLALGGSLGYLVRAPLSTWLFGMGEGSPRDARRWITALQQCPDPETAKSRYPQVAVKRFADGEWVFGISVDSHASPRGGTIVLKESSGRVRAFFGHVCGPSPFFLDNALRDTQSLADLYDPEDALMSWVRKEYQPQPSR